MIKEINSFLKENQKTMEYHLKKYIDSLDAPPQLVEAMEYSLMAGGKRIRPAFLLATLASLNKDITIGYNAACALEMIHTYSLIHDDLPAMDNDDYRRGQLTNHKVFGEALAILAGDALLTHAFSLLTLDSEEVEHVSDWAKLRMVQELSSYAGPKGMVGGQVLDMISENSPSLTLAELYAIHQHKTADLLICSVRFGCYLGQASKQQFDALTEFAKHIGLAFQIQDDILDEIGDENKLGKKVGSDRANEKTTFVSLLGLEGAREKLAYHVERSKEELKKAQVRDELLLQLTEYMIQRDH